MIQSDSAQRTLWCVEVRPAHADCDSRGAATLHDIHELGLTHVKHVAFSRLFLLEGNLQRDQVERIASELLTDPITEEARISRADDVADDDGQASVVEVHLKGGVMDPVAASASTAVADMGIATGDLAISTARIFRMEGVADGQQLELIARSLLYNDCIEEVYLRGLGWEDKRPAHLPTAPVREFELRHVSLRTLDDSELQKLSRDAHLFLSLEEMQAIQKHYRSLDREPTDLELEMFAQTWSEHCVHKTLKSAVRYSGAPLPTSARVKQSLQPDGMSEIHFDNLLKETVARATHDLMNSKQVDWCWSVFEDNAGIIKFDEEFGVAFKVETHNHPSAIEPYGGAATGVGGCIRDVMGCGLGAKPVANTDVFCVGDPSFPVEMLPKGILHPRRILKGVVSGVRDYGNRMGIPTVNGAVLFDDRYLGNPLVFCGCLGLIPRDKIHKQPQPGDLIVVIGGRTGRDGIHGATFSSAELTDTHADEFSHAVQIGDAITEKRVLDAMMRARDHEQGCLYTATTDCGAGGLSSAVGEMGAELGATVDLENVPLKYAGLRYDEIWISEAQERMVCSVPPANWEAFLKICESENVETTSIGTFRDDGRLVIRYRGQTVGDIDADFLHNAVPKTRKEAKWQPPEKQVAGAGNDRANATQEDQGEQALLRRLGSLNAASKEWIIRQYDHEVQGGSVVKALAGPGEGPSDGAVIRPQLSSNQGVALSAGICPELSGTDPYWMAVAAIDEAVRNSVCIGGNPARTAILDNFCWGNCEDPQTLGALVRACQGCYDAAVTYGTPFVSGKDSLNNEFALDAADVAKLSDRLPLQNKRIRIPETLLISAASIVDDIGRCLTMDLKPDAGSRLVLVQLKANTWPEVDLPEAAGMHRAVADVISRGLALAAHDCSFDGVLPAAAEMAFAGRSGLNLRFEQAAPFAPIASGYLLQVSQEKVEEIKGALKQLDGVGLIDLGEVDPEGDTVAWGTADAKGSLTLAELVAAWRSPLAW